MSAIREIQAWIHPLLHMSHQDIMKQLEIRNDTVTDSQVWPKSWVLDELDAIDAKAKAEAKSKPKTGVEIKDPVENALRELIHAAEKAICLAEIMQSLSLVPEDAIKSAIANMVAKREVWSIHGWVGFR